MRDVGVQCAGLWNFPFRSSKRARDVGIQTCVSRRNTLVCHQNRYVVQCCWKCTSRYAVRILDMLIVFRSALFMLICVAYSGDHLDVLVDATRRSQNRFASAAAATSSTMSQLGEHSVDNAGPSSFAPAATLADMVNSNRGLSFGPDSVHTYSVLTETKSSSAQDADTANVMVSTNTGIICV